MGTIHTKADSKPPVFTYGFVQYTVWVLSYLIQRNITAEDDSFLHQMR